MEQIGRDSLSVETFLNGILIALGFAEGTRLITGC
jgi:hypothetical protein